MRVFVAGATGAIGRPLISQLIDAGHEVAAMTRRADQAGALEEAGATAVVCDAFDADGLRAAVAAAAPEVVINELTKLPREFNPRKIDYGPTNRVRTEGGRNLVEAAAGAGAKRIIAQSIAFLYAPEGGPVKSEEDPPFLDAPPPFDEGLRAQLELERMTLSAPDMEGLVLRYGAFYGPGTYYSTGSATAGQIRARRYPIVGRGDGVFSFIHVEDAAGATVAAVERGSPGIYNVVDDDPAPMREWLREYAAALGAKPPRRVPRWLARLLAGRFATMFATELRGASNAKAKRELGWEPRYPSWRQGFREALG
jgi:nucleoside-diphosphate-sugar epimerase